MKKLDFAQFGEEKRDRMFQMLWTAYRAAYPKQAAGYENMKLCNRIGEHLEAISIEAPTPGRPACAACGRPAEAGDPNERALTKAKKNVLLLTGHEHGKLLAMAKSEEVGWTYLGGRDMEPLIAALEAAPEVEVEEKKGSKKK